MTALPHGWKIVRLADVADTALGKMLDRGNPKGLPQVPYLRNVNVQWGHIDTQDVHTMELADNERDRFAVRSGDLLVCEGGEIGRAAIWRGSEGYIAYQKAVHRIRSKGDLHLPFLCYLLEFYSANGTLGRFSTGSTIQHIPQQKLRELPVPLPSLTEQRRIVDILEDHLSRLDASGMLSTTIGRRLASYESSALSRCHDGRQRALDEVAMIQGGIQKHYRRAPKDNYYPFLRVANVTQGGLDLGDVHNIELFGDELDRLRLRTGDLLVVEGNGSPSQIGRAGIWDGSIDPCVHQNHLIRVRPNALLNPSYLEAVWNSPQNRRNLTRLASSSSGLYTLSVSKLKTLYIPVPSLARQAKLVDELSVVRDARRRLDVHIRAVSTKTGLLRRALLNAAFLGRLTAGARDLELVEGLKDV
jgi:type I restriction enzyme, S subunit